MVLTKHKRKPAIFDSRLTNFSELVYLPNLPTQFKMFSKLCWSSIATASTTITIKNLNIVRSEEVLDLVGFECVMVLKISGLPQSPQRG
jgi:hypothetical protein